MDRNVGMTDRFVRMGLGFVALIAALALFAGVGGLSGTVGTVAAPIVLAIVGAVLLVTGYTQTCPAYRLIGFRTLNR
ncbi:YgaP family membrane protein [Halapricum salinum]|uniref:DUF2892 domain-containing protein n=1 Tax=Halapricum salinum TaxID=1457250 RepID=A0A4D6HG40_9EURY|nr:DUF2892 domain-containing protein [Halapricum salinum]QCC52581.1 DUF2892 domain-containing protein [Halapricum salinum]